MHMMYLEQGGDWLLTTKFKHASFIRTSSLSTAQRIEDLGVSSEKVKVNKTWIILLA
jgi:hypothetical protein